MRRLRQITTKGEYTELLTLKSVRSRRRASWKMAQRLARRWSLVSIARRDADGRRKPVARRRWRGVDNHMCGVMLGGLEKRRRDTKDLGRISENSDGYGKKMQQKADWKRIFAVPGMSYRRCELVTADFREKLWYCTARRWEFLKSNKMLVLNVHKREEVAERVASKMKQCPGVRAVSQKVWRKDDRVGATAVTPDTWAGINDLDGEQVVILE